MSDNTSNQMDAPTVQVKNIQLNREIYDSYDKYLEAWQDKKRTGKASFETLSNSQYKTTSKCCSWYTNADRLKSWIYALAIRYLDQLGSSDKYNVIWTDQTSESMIKECNINITEYKIKPNLEQDETKLLNIKIFLSNGTIMVQGNNCQIFMEQEFDYIKQTVNQINFSFQDQVLKPAIQQDSIPTLEEIHSFHVEDQVPDKEHLEPEQKLNKTTDTMDLKNTSSFVSKDELNNAVKEIKCEMKGLLTIFESKVVECLSKSETENLILREQLNNKTQSSSQPINKVFLMDNSTQCENRSTGFGQDPLEEAYTEISLEKALAEVVSLKGQLINQEQTNEKLLLELSEKEMVIVDLESKLEQKQHEIEKYSQSKYSDDSITRIKDLEKENKALQNDIKEQYTTMKERNEVVVALNKQLFEISKQHCHTWSETVPTNKPKESYKDITENKNIHSYNSFYDHTQRNNSNHDSYNRSRELRMVENRTTNKHSTVTWQNKKKVLIIGDSNTHDIQEDRLTRRCQITKKEAFTIPDADRIVDQVIATESDYDVILLHVGTNDIESVSPDVCVNKISDIFRKLEGSGLNTRIVMSQAVPRKNPGLNKKIQELNIKLQYELWNKHFIYLCDNSYLALYNGEPQHKFYKSVKKFV